MRDSSRYSVPIVVLLMLVATLVLVPDARLAATFPPTFEAMPLPELSGGARVAGGSWNWPAGMVLPGQTRETEGPWKACVWFIVSEWPWDRFDLPSLDATRPSGAHIGGLALADTDTVMVAAGFSYNMANRMKPIVWRKKVNATQWTMTPLPTLEGLEGAVLSVVGEDGDDILGEEPNDLVGWSSATGPVEKAVLWSRTGEGGWVVRMLSHYAPSLPGRALDGFVPQPGDTFICGWAEDAEGDTNAVVWERSTGPWTRTELPLLAGGTQGMANSVLGEEPNDSFFGWSENAVGEHRAVRWYYDGGWQVEELGQLAGCSQSAGILGEEPNDLYPYAYVVGRSWDPTAPLATLWGLSLTGEEGYEFTSDLNDLVTGGDVPTLTDATGIIMLDPVDEIWITANSVPAPIGSYARSLTSDPHGYVLVGDDPTGIDPETPVLARFALYQNVPNPFNPTTTISFVLSERTRALLAVYDVEGRHVKTLVDEVLDGGPNEMIWDGTDAQGHRVSSGVYFYRLKVGNQTITKKLTVLK